MLISSLLIHFDRSSFLAFFHYFILDATSFSTFYTSFCRLDTLWPINLFSFYSCLCFRCICISFRHFIHYFVIFDTFWPIILFSFFSWFHFRCRINFDILRIILSFWIHFDRSSFLAFIPAYVLDAYAFHFDISCIISSLLIHFNRSSFLAFIPAYVLDECAFHFDFSWIISSCLIHFDRSSFVAFFLYFILDAKLISTFYASFCRFGFILTDHPS